MWEIGVLKKNPRSLFKKKKKFQLITQKKSQLIYVPQAGANEYDDKVEATKRKLFCYCCGLTFSTLESERA